MDGHLLVRISDERTPGDRPESDRGLVRVMPLRAGGDRARRLGGRRAHQERRGADVLAGRDAVADAEVGDVVHVHVRRERAVVVLDPDVAAAAAVEAELAELDADHRAGGDRDDRPAARAVEIDAAVALAALRALDALAARTEMAARLLGHQLGA